MSTTRPETRDCLHHIRRYFDANHFAGFHTSRTVKKCYLSMADIARAAGIGKVEPCVPADHIEGKRLPFGVHGVNVFAVPEMKGRRRLITEPHLNFCANKDGIPRVEYPTRLELRQRLRTMKYMLQIDFEAYCDALPIPGTLRNKFVFRARNGAYFRLRTLPTGARWSVAVGQGVTWTIVDIDTPVTIMTMIDWDDPLPFLDPQVHDALHAVGARRIHNLWEQIANARTASYVHEDYDVVCFTDASLGGWGAYAHRHFRQNRPNGLPEGQNIEAESITAYQQIWTNELDRARRPRARSVLRGSDSALTDDCPYFTAKHPAHAEPRAAESMLRQLVDKGLPDGAKVALVTDHYPIVHAQKQLNDFGGIGRGLSLNKLYECAYDKYYDRNIKMVFLDILGQLESC